MSDNNSGNWFARHKVLSVVLALILVAIVATAASGGGKKSENGSQTTANSSSPASTKASNSSSTKSSIPKIGETARDGKFEFVVKSIQCGKSEVVSPDSDYLRKSAQGQYCIVTMTVKNIGNEQQGFFSTNQKLLDSGSKQYSSDDIATAYATPTSQQSNWSQINPGNSIDSTVVFDIPKDVTPATTELHDSAFSGGAKVNIQ